MDFIGKAEPLTIGGLRAAANSISVSAALILAIMEVETTGCGFLRNRAPKILYERHVFSRETGHRYDISRPDISNPTPGGYGLAGTYQYDRLEKAMRVDEPAALRSTSWGLAQIMGFNHAMVGYDDVYSMTGAFKDGEDAQVMAIAAYCEHFGIADDLKNKNWRAVARAYNGRNYEQNNYHNKLAFAFAKHNREQSIDIDLRAKQVRLMYAGLYNGAIDGIDGIRTQRAIRSAAMQSIEV